LSALGHGDPHAASRLLPRVYDELRKLAAQRMAREHKKQMNKSAILQELAEAAGVTRKQVAAVFDALTGRAQYRRPQLWWFRA
jgi:hypothetical protein